MVGEFEDTEECRRVAIKFSEDNDVVESSEWANLTREVLSGGETTKNRIWITDGEREKLIKRDSTIPEGWKTGRSYIKCIFRDSSFQKELSDRYWRTVDRDSEAFKASRLSATQKMMKVRDHSKCGIVGDKHPCKRPEVRAKIGLANRRKTVSDEVRKKMSLSRMRVKRGSNLERMNDDHHPES